jgi:uncharacterized membrane protein (DUF485 family)
MSSPNSPQDDLTPESASPTDIAPLGRSSEKPAHERTADEEMRMADWDAIAADPDFKSLLKAKAAFIIPATIFFVIFYFALPISVGWLPGLMETRVLGDVNLAYLFSLSQFFMAWILAFLYVAVSKGWDRRATALLAKFRKLEVR